MEPVISISEVVEKREMPGGMVEVCAVIESTFDKAQQQLVAQLGSHLQQSNATTHLRPRWLPADQTLREHVARAEASDVARDMFHRWVRRVRQTIPNADPLPLE